MECLEAEFCLGFCFLCATRISRVIEVKPMLLLRFSILYRHTQKLRHNGLLKGTQEEGEISSMYDNHLSPIFFSSCHLSQMTPCDAIYTIIMHSILTQKRGRTVFENHIKSHSTLRAKRATLTF